MSKKNSLKKSTWIGIIVGTINVCIHSSIYIYFMILNPHQPEAGQVYLWTFAWVAILMAAPWSFVAQSISKYGESWPFFTILGLFINGFAVGKMIGLMFDQPTQKKKRRKSAKN